MEISESLPTENNEEIFSRLLNTLENKFFGEGCDFKLEPGRHLGYVLQTKWLKANDEAFQEKLDSILEREGFFKVDRRPDFLIDRKIIGGKVNWRGWFNTPELMSESSQHLLDEIAGLREVADIAARREDTLGKISSFLNIAHDKGLITGPEYRDLYSDVQSKGRLR
jgi:hypothetical protein